MAALDSYSATASGGLNHLEIIALNNNIWTAS